MNLFHAKYIIYHFANDVKKYPKSFHKKEKTGTLCLFSGDPSESRTPDTMIKSHVLYLLS